MAVSTENPAKFTMPLVTLGDIIETDQLDLLKKACVEHGFLLLNNKRPACEGPENSYHIDPAKITSLWQTASDLFDAPLEAKQEVSVRTSTNNRGYFSALDHAEYNKDPNGVKIKDNKEGFFFGSNGLIAPGNRVPRGKEALLPEIESYMDVARAACVRVMRAIVQTGLLTNLAPEEMDPEAFVAKYMADPIYMLKALKYPPTDGNTDAHTDYGCITLLLPGDEGLQVHYAGEWHPVPLVPGAFVVNFGDLLQMWSGGVIKSTIHRVIYNNPNGTYRYSVPFFMHPSKGSSIQLGEGKPPVDSYSYVLSRFDSTYKHRMEAAAAGGSN